MEGRGGGGGPDIKLLIFSYFQQALSARDGSFDLLLVQTSCQDRKADGTSDKLS